MSSHLDHNPNIRVGWDSLLPISGNPKVTMVVGCYKRTLELQCLLASIACQTHQNFEVICVHDGPDLYGVQEAINHWLTDPRFSFHCLPEPSGDPGNSSKEYGSQLATGEFIGHSNDDNYYAPIYFEWMLHKLVTKPADFAYCNMVHSHAMWAPTEVKPAYGYIDGGGWICRANIVKATAWPENKKHRAADGQYVEALLTRCSSVTKIPGHIFVHN